MRAEHVVCRFERCGPPVSLSSSVSSARDRTSMKQTLSIFALAALLAGCSIEHGHLDFAAPPLLEVPLGGYSSLMVFGNSTVLRTKGGTWYTLSVPFYVLLPAAIGIPSLVWFIFRRRAREKAS
jgi:hypothetical protein